MKPVRTTIAVVAVSICTACGSSTSASSTTSGTSTSSTAPPARTASTPTQPSASPTTATSPTVITGPVRATLHGASHAPVAGKSWSYSVKVTDAGGKPLSGTVETEFVLPSIGVVGKETPPVHPLKAGVLHDSLTFPAAALGHPIMLVTVIHTSVGSVALGWPVNVKK
jgi:hypothetical protein